VKNDEEKTVLLIKDGKEKQQRLCRKIRMCIMIKREKKKERKKNFFFKVSLFLQPLKN